MPEISIIIPCLNAETTIQRCIDSILSQTFTNFEIIVQDGKSQDDTIRIVEAFNDSRISIYSEKDNGVYDAMNKAIDKAKGEWLYFLGSDDWLYADNVLESIVHALKTTSSKFVYGNVKLNGSFSSWDNDIYRGKTTIGNLLESNICHQAIFYHKNVFRSGLRYNLSYPSLADYDMNMLCAYKFALQYINIIIANFTTGGISATIPDETFEKEKWVNAIKYFGFQTLQAKTHQSIPKIKEAAKTLASRKQYGLAIKAYLIYKIMKLNKKVKQ